MAPPKAKGQKMALGEFLTDTSLGSWADEMEDAPMPWGRSGYGGGDRSFGSGGGYGSGGYSDRGYSVREQLPLPTKPPYTVHLGNMSFDATEGDIQEFFAGCSVTSVRIVEDKLDRKPKGFGYAEFATLDGLKKALEFNGTQFQGRNIRVSVAEPQKDRPDARDFGNWDRKGPLADIPGQRKPSDRSNFGGERSGGGFGGRNFDNTSDAGGERPNRRPAYEHADGKVRDFGNWERKGPLTPTLPASIPAINRPVSRDGPRERRNSPAWGEGTNRSQEGSRPPRKEFVERPVVDRAPTAPELDNKWRSKMRPDPPAPAPAPAPATSPTPSNKELSVPSSPAAPAAAAAGLPTSRPKLNLQKRTVSQVEPSPALPTGVSDAKASPFGAARPIDTTAREQEVLARKEREAKEKKEAEDRAREEKKAADEKAKEDRRLAKEADQAEKAAAPKDKVNGQTKEAENGAETPGKNYQILRRATNDDATSVNNEHTDENANGYITEDKAVKPQEITRNIPVRKVNGVDAKPAEGSASPSVEALEEDGWSTVSKPQKPRKNGNQARQPSRAIAS